MEVEQKVPTTKRKKIFQTRFLSLVWREDLNESLQFFKILFCNSSNHGQKKFNVYHSTHTEDYLMLLILREIEVKKSN